MACHLVLSWSGQDASRFVEGIKVIGGGRFKVDGALYCLMTCTMGWISSFKCISSCSCGCSQPASAVYLCFLSFVSVLNWYVVVVCLQSPEPAKSIYYLHHLGVGLVTVMIKVRAFNSPAVTVYILCLACSVIPYLQQ